MRCIIKCIDSKCTVILGELEVEVPEIKDNCSEFEFELDGNVVTSRIDFPRALSKYCDYANLKLVVDSDKYKYINSKFVITTTKELPNTTVYLLQSLQKEDISK